MAGDPLNANLWTDADVYVGELDAVNPATIDDPFGVTWDAVGLLNGDDGFGETRDEDTNDIYAWGGILVRTSRSHFKLTKSFTALEDNETTFGLVWPGSSSSQIIVPKPAKKKIAFEMREGDKVRRVITNNYGEISLSGDLTQNETDLESFAFQAVIFPSGAGVLFDKQGTS
ncbi:hypothetical protein [Embleya sp. NPDC001921]